MLKKIVSNTLGVILGIVAYRLGNYTETWLFDFWLSVLAWLETALAKVIRLSLSNYETVDMFAKSSTVLVSVLFGWLVCWLLCAPTQKGKIPGLMALAPLQVFIAYINYIVLIRNSFNPPATHIQMALYCVCAALVFANGWFGKPKSPLYKKMAS